MSERDRERDRTGGFPCQGGGGSGRETVCIETGRVMDACRDRDCYENVRVRLTRFGREIIERTNTVRTKSAYITGTNIAVEPVRFNRGFYSVTIRFYIKCEFEACVCAGHPQEFDGIAVVEKHVVLFGGESGVNVFRSTSDGGEFCSAPEPCPPGGNVPTAVVEVVDPIVLGTSVVEKPTDCGCCCCCPDVPETISARMRGEFSNDDGDDARYLSLTLGLFSVIRIVRPMQYLVNATEYSVPDKVCAPDTPDDPCGIFRKMPFPTGEFSASGPLPQPGEKRCGC